MKVVILAGGFGTRLSDYSERVPKPMVTIGNRPILWHIMKLYENYGYNNFYLALGYKSEKIKEYFRNYRELNSDFTVDLKTGSINSDKIEGVDWKVTLINTGLDTMTGGRVKRMQNYIGNEPFLLTYGDGVSNINIKELVEFHRSHGKLVTVSAVHPVARFGELDINSSSQVTSFKEKPQTTQGWINGGFFVIEPSFFDYIDNDNISLEREPLEKVAKMGQLMAYHHDGFWQCMDTRRDREVLEELWLAGNAPWKM